MPKENEADTQLDELEDLPAEGDEGQEDTTDWKAKAKSWHGSATRYKNQASRFKQELDEERKKSTALATNNNGSSSDKKGFDYGQKAFLRANGITPDEYELVQEVMSATGKSLEDVVDSKYFQAELKERRDAKASKDAIPSGTKRSASASRDQVEYWLAKGELPPAGERELRQKVVNAKLKAEQSKSQFTDNPVA
jgi:hypothetical protein